jgi:hypothetical protein
LSSDGSTSVFNCQSRLCAVDIAKGALSLVAKEQSVDGFDSAWIVLNKVRYLISGVKNQLVSLRPL